MTTYAQVRRRILSRLPAMEPALTAEVLKTCVFIANAPDAQQAAIDLIADGRDIGVSEQVVADLAEALPSELADLQALLRDTLATPGTTLLEVLTVVAREFLAG